MNLIKKGYFLFILSLFLFSSNIHAESSKVPLSELNPKEIIEIAPGQQKTFSLERTADRINIGTKDIIKVFMKDKLSMEIVGKKRGFTTILIQYSDGKIEEYGIRVLSMLPLDVVAQQLREIFTPIKGIERIEKVGEKIVIEGEIFDKQYQDYYRKTIGMYKDIVIDKVYISEKKETVQIDVRVIEVNQENTSDLGIQWFGEAGWEIKIKDTYRHNTPNIFEVSLDDVTVKVNALAKEGKARILATPKLLVESGGKASFLVGGEIPIAQITGLASSVDWKKYGTYLEIAPKVMENGRIFIEVKTTESELDYSHVVAGYPSISSKEANTNLTMKENTTFAIAGLLSRQETEEVSKVPLFGDIPILGYLFKKKNKVLKDIETIVLLTPSIIREESLIKPSKGIKEFIDSVDKKD